MKKNIYQTVWAAMIIMLTVITACGNSSSEAPLVVNKGPLQGFVIQCGSSYFRRAIDQTTHMIGLSGIHYSTDITGVDYQLVEGATIVPNPKEVSTWKETQEFTVNTADGEKVVYTVNLPDLFEEPEKTSKVIIGYVTANEIDAQIDNIHWEYLTHVNVSFASVKADGTLNTDKVPPSTLNQIRDKAHEHGVKVLISINKNSSGEFRTAINNESVRDALVQNIIAFTKARQLDGFDIDYEDYDNWNNTSLVAFAKALHEAKEEDMLMTCAVICWLRYTSEWQQYFDYINIMSYGKIKGGSVDNPKQHASYEDFVSDLNHWVTIEKSPKSKIIGGLPFYGFSWDSDIEKDALGGVRFQKIITHFTGKGYTAEEIADADQITKTLYNGRPTIRRKCRYVMDNDFGGVMIWQLFQDAKQEELKLIKVVGEEIMK